MKYMFSEWQIWEDVRDATGVPFIQMRPPDARERLFIGHVVFDSRVKLHWPTYPSMENIVFRYVSLNRKVNFRWEDYSVVLYSRKQLDN